MSVQGSASRFRPSFLNFVPAVAYRYLPRAFPLVAVYIFASAFPVVFVYNCRALEFGLLSGRIPFLCYSALSGKLF